MTKSELIAKRDATYRYPFRCCDNCRWIAPYSRCNVEQEEEPQVQVQSLGVCDLWEAKEGK